MNANTDNWWGLHLRKARGERLSEEEEDFYDSELARQDREAPALQNGIEVLKKMRAQLAELGKVNDELRSRWTELNQEIRVVEQSLTQKTREALGVKE